MMHKTISGAAVGLLVAASFAASGGVTAANHDDLQADIDGSDVAAVARAHGLTISTLARETQDGPEKGSTVSAAARLHGAVVSEVAKSAEHGDITDREEHAGRPADAGANGAAASAVGRATAASAAADRQAFGGAKAATARAAGAGRR